MASTLDGVEQRAVGLARLGNSAELSTDRARIEQLERCSCWSYCRTDLVMSLGSGRHDAGAASEQGTARGGTSALDGPSKDKGPQLTVVLKARLVCVVAQLQDSQVRRLGSTPVADQGTAWARFKHKNSESGCACGSERENREKQRAGHCEALVSALGVTHGPGNRKGSDQGEHDREQRGHQRMRERVRLNSLSHVFSKSVIVSLP